MNKKLRAGVILAIELVVAAFVGLIIVREIHAVDLSLYVVGAPFFVFGAFGAILYLLDMVKPGQTLQRRFQAASLLFFFVGFFASFTLFVVKYSSNALISYVSAWMPAIFFVIGSLVLGLGSLILAFCEQEKKPKKPKPREE